jgi:putative zinc finger/helix-turn-helix YgiT family protein
MNCIKCRKTELVEQRADVPADVKGESVLVKEFPVLVCGECGYKTIRGHQMQEFMRIAADVYRQKHVLLTSVEIRERRERLGHSQEEFANYLEVGIASIKRWELGYVQDRAMDRLIRLSTDLAEAYGNYKRIERMVSPTHFWVPTGTRTWCDDVSINQWEKIISKRVAQHRAAKSY